MEIWKQRSYFLNLLCEHLFISTATVILVAIFGIAIGIWVFYSKKAKTFVMPTINFLYTIPSIAMFGLFIPIVGIGLKNAVIVIVLYGLLPIVRNTYTGMKEVPEQLVEAATGLGSTPIQLFKKIYFPLALPSILSGLRITVVMDIALVGLAALIGAGGLGESIFRGLNTMNTQMLVTGSLGISLFAILGDKFVSIFEKDYNFQHLITHNASKKQKRVMFTYTFIFATILLAAIIYQIPNTTKTASKNVVVASKPTSEQFILGEIISQSIENNTNISVTRKFGIGGGTTNIHPSMVSGAIDIYPDYTGTIWLSVLKKDPSLQVNLNVLKDDYKEKYNLNWLGLLGFNNTYAIAIPESIAEEKNINTISDLVNHSPDFTFGAEFDFFERPDAYKGLVKVYPFKFKKLFELDINLRYKAIEQGKINAVDAFNTDAQINALKLKVLEDDKQYFPSYEAGIIVREEILKKYPEIKEILTRLNGKITNAKMRQMNYEVEILKKTPQEVAKEFLLSLNFNLDK